MAALFSRWQSLLAVLGAFAAVTTTAAAEAANAGNDGDNINAVLAQIESMRLEHARALQQMQAAHAQDMELLKNALLGQQQQARRLESDNSSAYSGMNIKTNRAKITMGVDADINIMRREDGVLEIFADELIVHGKLSANALAINGSDFSTGKHTVLVEVITSNATSSNSVDTIYAEFYLPSLAYWTTKLFLLEGADQGQIHKQTFTLPDVPSQIRLSGSGNDAWGFQQMAVWIDDADEMVIVCSGIIGDIPSMGANGHWIDGDGSGGAPTTVTHDISPACASRVDVTAETGAVTSSDTTNTVYVSFYLEEADEWTDPMVLFTGSSIGDVEEESYGLDSAPSKIAFTISSSNAWGFDYLELQIDGYSFVLSCDGDQTGMSSTSMHWVDGDGSGGVTDELILDIEHTVCDS